MCWDIIVKEGDGLVFVLHVYKLGLAIQMAAGRVGQDTTWKMHFFRPFVGWLEHCWLQNKQQHIEQLIANEDTFIGTRQRTREGPIDRLILHSKQES